jgi:hypothetical protein
MHRTQTDDIDFRGCRLRVRYALIYGHDEGWKLGKIVKGIEQDVAETINRSGN